MKRTLCRIVRLLVGVGLAALPLLTETVHGAGVTIITHGFLFDQAETPIWMDEMAEAIANRTGDPSAVSIYSVTITFNISTQDLEVAEHLDVEPEPWTSGNRNGEIILKVNWTDLANLPLPWNDLEAASTEHVAAVLVTYVLSSPHQWLEHPLHFIGHSRGASLGCAFSEMLATRGVWVEQLTTLDPHPVNNNRNIDPVPAIDAPLRIYENVVFADNYFENFGCTYPHGQDIGAATNLHLNERFENDTLPDDCEELNLPNDNHGRVHDWYHDTIDLIAPTESAWYTDRAHEGFYYSRIAQGNRPSSGLAYYHGGSEGRFLVTHSGSQWPNVSLANVDNKWAVTNGQPVKILTRWSDTDSTNIITYATDNDTNPYNNSPGDVVSVVTNPPSAGGYIPNSPVNFWYPNLSQNGRYFYAKITDQVHTRYFYLPKPFSVSSGPPEPPPAQQGNDLSRDATLEWDDRRPPGDGDGIPEAGEALEMKVRLRNNSGSTVRNVEATLTVTAGNVTITDPYSFYGDLAPNGSSLGSDYNMVLNFTSTTLVTFRLRATYSKNGVDYFQELPFSVTFYPNGATEPKFEVDHVVWDDTPPRGNGNGSPESGENPLFYIHLKNVGNANAVDVRAKAVADAPFIAVRDEWIDYNDLLAGAGPQPPRGSDKYHLDQNIPMNFAGRVSADIHVIYGQSQVEQVIRDYPLFDVGTAAWLQVLPFESDFGLSSTTQDVTVVTAVQNLGSRDLPVTSVTATNADTTWTGNVLQGSIPPGGSRTLNVTIHTAALQGPLERSVVINVPPEVRIRKPGKDDRIVITGTVGDSQQFSEFPVGGNVSAVDISVPWIVWNDSRNANLDIFAYNLGTGEERTVCDDIASQTGPKISGNLIAWTDARNEPPGGRNKDVYAYDLSHPELGNFVITNGPGNQYLLGVDGNLVAVASEFETLVDPEGGPTASALNLIVYEYRGNAQFVEKYKTTFTPQGGTNPRDTVDTRADFGEGLLVFERERWEYDSNNGWHTTNRRVEIIDFAAGEMSPRTALNSQGAVYAAAAHRFSYVDEDGNDVPQLWLWHSDGQTDQLTTEDLEVEDNFVGLGGPLDKEAVVFEYWNGGSNPRPGLYWLDRESASPPTLLVADDQVANLRQDGMSVVWSREPAAGDPVIRYLFLKQGDPAINAANITFSDDHPIEGAPMQVSVTVQNLAAHDYSGELAIRLYDGDPDIVTNPISAALVITNGLPAHGQAVLQFSGILAGVEGTHDIYAKLSPQFLDNPSNNKSSKQLVVLDSDSAGPQVENLTVEEYPLNDGTLRSDDLALICFSLFDPSGVAWKQFRLDGILQNPTLISNRWCITLGPFRIGVHSIDIVSADNDTSNATNSFHTTFTVTVPPNCSFHPADTDSDGRITPREVIRYDFCRVYPSTNCVWWPQSISASYVVNADFVRYSTANGAYCCDSNRACPLCWISCSTTTEFVQPQALELSGGALSSVESATRILPDSYTPGVPLSVVIQISPSPEVISYAVEETLPVGWIATDVSDGGMWDPTQSVIRWPLFNGPNSPSRTLMYKARPPVGDSGPKAFRGIYVVDPGVEFEIGGDTISNDSQSRPHDLSVATVKVPKTVNLTAAKPSVTKRLIVQIQNLSDHDELISDFDTLGRLLQVTVTSRGECAAPSAVLVAGPPNTIPATLGPGEKMNVFFDVTFTRECMNDPLKFNKRTGEGADFEYTVTVNHAALYGEADTNPDNDDCPRDPNPATKDKGCGGKGPDGALLTDVVEK